MPALPVCHVSGHQSDAIKKQQLEPGHLDNFIRPNALPSLLAWEPALTSGGDS